ncbi:SDR family NAD(P)-dependent oxidoreductase [Trujillonella endophytica]|uniref:NAD(P)-dependent dehydrogenase, short-chain alcohol dehydrogenase family n=1 Tax=Trujillonella endophytica TaxID=673521 RepID=A0A1H8RTT8_9ACTN|nr:SDR family NAD(P)-dependent oxidoreductase [Trujillella endophytica]SEO69752.1 NAD(P)-dependent dehydrogenase, short-chain alcohol dehydrogenase family [Trujillella endophytica]
MSGNEVRFDGRSILVTGAGRGLGRAHALLLASRGAHVVVADSGVEMNGAGGDVAVADAVVDEIRSAGGTAVACAADLASEDGSIRAVASCVESFGRLDAIIHNASSVPRPLPVERLSSAEFDLCMRVNVYAGFWLTRAAWPHMAERGFGRIVYTTSGAMYGSAGAIAYAAAKSAFIGLARSFAVAGKPHGINVNVLAPSARTRMHGTGDPTTPYMDWLLRTMVAEKVSIGAAYLVSEECDFSGEVLSFEGGHISRVTLAENEGFFGPGESIEEVRDAAPAVLADSRYVHPRTLNERMLWSAEMFGVAESLDAAKVWR